MQAECLKKSNALNKMAVVMQITFPNAFSLMEFLADKVTN